jgi:S1-C subfamily serine protease
VVIQTSAGLGSGIIFDTKGDIVTNAHVVDGSKTFQVTLANAKTTLPSAMSWPAMSRAYLGVQVADASGAPGPVVVSVHSGSPAASAGIAKGEAITSVDGTKTATADDLTTKLAGLAPGKSVKVTVVRSSGAETTVTVVLGELPG